jgi:transposase
MAVIGIDAHKQSHTLVAIDPTGRKLGEKTVPATTDGHHDALHWARTHYPTDLLWAVEDVRGLTARLEADLLAAGQRVVRVTPHLMAGMRRTARTPGKSDPIDALAVARVALREPDLPIARHTPATREIKLLIDHRADLVQHRTATMQRLLWRIHELDPLHRVKPGALGWTTTQDALSEWLADQPGPVAGIARDELADIIALTPRIVALEKQLALLVRAAAPSLLALYGCGDLTAARILGETADIARFKSEAAFARWAGAAPIPRWSGSTRGRQRTHKGGNRQINSALHQIAMTQIKSGGPGQQYYLHCKEARGSHAAAMLRLKRRIARSVYTRLRRDHACIDNHAALVALISTNDQWKQLLGKRKRTPTPSRTAIMHLPPTPLTDHLTTISQAWEAALLQTEQPRPQQL